MLFAMSRIIWKPDFAVRLNAIRTNKVQIRRSWICLPLTILATQFCLPSLSVAQQNDRSILVLEGSKSSAGSNAQVELETDLPQATSSALNFKSIPASTQPYLPPPPPAGMAASSDNAAAYKYPSQDTQAATRTSKTHSAIEPLRQHTSDDHKVLATSTTLPSPDSGTFASRLPGDTRPPSSLQGDNSFGSSPAPSSLRSGSASNSSRNRFGDFGTLPAARGTSRFASNSSTASSESKPIVSAPPTEPKVNRFPQPAVASASPQQPRQPAAAAQNRFGSPQAATTSNRFAQPALPQASEPQTGRSSGPSITTRPIPTPPISSRANAIRPSENTQSVTSLNDNSRASERFPSATTKFANPGLSSSTQPSSLQPRTRKSTSFDDSGMRAASNSNSRRMIPRDSGLNSNSSSAPMINRQASSSSSSSLLNSSAAGQSNQGSSRLAPQTSRFANQSGFQSLRGDASNNDLRNNVANNQSRLTQQPTNRNQSSGGQATGKATRESINFAKQQFRNIQTTSADANGTPVRLQEMFLEPLTGTQRKKMVAQYWETYYDLAALKISADYEGWLNSISTSGSEKELLAAAQQMAADQKLAAKIQLGKSQSRLMDFMPNPKPSEFTPLPADEPLVEHYVTDYEKYKRVRTLPSSLRGIDPMLASTLKLITQRASTVSMAKNAVDQAGQAIRNRQIPLASAIAAGQLWRDSQLDMVASAVSYNQAISDFVLTLEPSRSPEQLTAFMLGTPKNGSRSSSTIPQNQSSRSANQQGFSPNRQQFR